MPQWTILKAVVLLLCCIDGIVASVGRVATNCKHKAPPPEGGTICGVRGKIPIPESGDGDYSYGNGTLGAKLVRGLQECLGLCLKRAYPLIGNGVYACGSVGYNKTSRACLLSSYSIGEFEPDQTSDTRFWSPSCFDCPDYCPQKNVSFADIDGRPKAANLLDNGSFDDSKDISLSGPWFFINNNSSRPELIPRSRSSGPTSRALKFRKRGSHFDAFPGQAYPACIGQRYLFKFDWKLAISNTHYPYFELGYEHDFYENKTPWVFKIFSDPTNADPIVGGWVTSEMSYVEDDRFEVYGQAVTTSLSLLGSGGTLFLDNVGVYPISSPIKTKPETELVRNGDFETGHFTHWRTYASQDTGKPKVVSANFSSYVVKFPPYSTPYIAQDITTRLDTRYVVSANYTTDCSGGYSVFFSIESKYGPDYSWGRQIRQGFDTYEFENVFRAARTEYILVAGTEASAGCNVYMDNFSVREAL